MNRLEKKNEALRSERMGTMPEGKLLLSMAVPMMLSMLVQALYNVVDSIYVARVSEDCLSALSLAFPAQNIMIGLATGTGVGVTALVSRALGSGNRKEACRVAGNSLFLAICCWAVMCLFGFTSARAFINMQTDSASIRAYGGSYLRIVTTVSLFLYMEICFERMLQATGQMKLSMAAQMIGAVTNIILDPFFIFGWLGLPAMGTAGAAIATVIGQGAGALAGMIFHWKYNRDIRISLSDCRPVGRIIGNIYRIGAPSILMVGIGAATNYLMNRILLGFTSTAVAVYGAYSKLQSFFFMPVFGINNGIIPIIGFNYGAGKKERIYRTIRYGVGYAAVLITIGFVVFLAIPGKLLGAFSASENMLRIGVPALRIISFHFPVAAFCVIAGSACQALGKSMYSFLTTILRQVAALIPAAYLLSLSGNIDRVWLAFPISEVVSCLATVFFLKRALSDMEKTLSARAQNA